MSDQRPGAGAPIGAGFLYAAARRVIAVKPEEVPALAWAWLYIFAVLSSYYIMRPIREQMAVAGGVQNIQWLFTATLAGLLLLNVPFAYLVKTLPRTRFIPITYRFFAANILLFAVILHFSDAAHSVWIGRAFFVWISIFNLFVVSVFWALVVDVFNSEQGKRLFGFIAAARNHWRDLRLKHHGVTGAACAGRPVAGRRGAVARSRGAGGGRPVADFRGAACAPR